jgi:prohibitin 1
MGMFGAEEEPLVSHSSTSNNNTRGNATLSVTPRVFLKYALLIVFLIVLAEMVFIVPPGAVGIVVMLGKVQAFESGMHYRIPLMSRLEIMSAKTQLLEEKNTIPTKEGLNVELDTAILYHLDAKKAATLYKEVGANYEQILLKPEAASAVRGMTSESEAKALYSSGRTMIQDTLKEELVKKLGPRGIVIEDVLLKDIGLPEQLSKSIELKVQAEQESARMVFVLQKEEQEAKRKAIEAGGVADFQRIVSQGISPELLKWKGIEATEKFANSPNTKIVIMGNGGDSLPVILSADDHHN